DRRRARSLPRRLPAPVEEKLLRSQADVLPAVAAQAQIGLLLVAPEALDGAQARAVLAHFHARLGRDLLVGAGLQELADPEAAGVARGAQGRERVVGADDLVAVGDVGFRPEEERAVVPHPVQKISRVFAEDLDVLGRNAIGFRYSFFS